MFKNYWFSTGSPEFLIEQMRKFDRFDVENSVIDSSMLDKYDIENLALIPLLFQTGYLTIKKLDSMTGEMVLDYPNKEVRQNRASGKTITAIGVNFNSDEKQISEWIEEIF
jgi:hypothetical protein